MLDKSLVKKMNICMTLNCSLFPFSFAYLYLLYFLTLTFLRGGWKKACSQETAVVIWENNNGSLQGDSGNRDRK